MCSCFKVDKDTDDNLIRNGGILLEKLIALNNGKGNPIRCFSIKELDEATNNYDQNQVIRSNYLCKMYKGFLQDRLVIIRKYEKEHSVADPFSDIVFSSELSVHKNVLKLLGCCLESIFPILVFEYAEKEMLEKYVLTEYRAQFRPLSWKNRLKIATDVANVVAYLHIAFSRPIVHRGLTILNIMIDEENVAKVNDFSCSISIPEGETHLQDDRIVGTYQYLAPEYWLTGRFNEKIDVYSFGMVLLVLLTGSRPRQHFSLVSEIQVHVEKEKLGEIIDPIIAEEEQWPGKQHHLKAFALLALRCTCGNPDDRPEITYVAKQLRQMYQSLF